MKTKTSVLFRNCLQNGIRKDRRFVAGNVVDVKAWAEKIAARNSAASFRILTQEVLSDSGMLSVSRIVFDSRAEK